MSIEVTNLTYTQGSDVKNIINWFEENAAEYFDKCRIVDEKGIVLKKGEEDYLLIANGGGSFYARVFVNDQMTVSMNNGNAEYISRLAKTPHGIAVGLARGGAYAQEFPYSIFITKTDKGNIGVVSYSAFSDPGTANTVFFESIGGSTNPNGTPITPNVIANDVTTFTPVVCDKANGEYMPNCFFTTFSQYKGLECIFTAGGEEYLYNGFIAMR